MGNPGKSKFRLVNPNLGRPYLRGDRPAGASCTQPRPGGQHERDRRFESDVRLEQAPNPTDESDHEEGVSEER